MLYYQLSAIINWKCRSGKTTQLETHKVKNKNNNKLQSENERYTYHISQCCQRASIYHFLMYQSAEETSGKTGIINVAARTKIKAPKRFSPKFALPETDQFQKMPKR